MAEFDIRAAMPKVEEYFRGKFPKFQTVKAGRFEDDLKVNIPALLIMVTDLEPNPEGGAHDGRWPCYLHLEAQIIIGARVPGGALSGAQAGAAIAAAVNNQYMGVDWGAGEVRVVAPDDFAPAADEFEIWKVEWRHEVEFGTDLNALDDWAPTRVLVSFAPDIGAGHEPDYRVVANVE